MTQGAAVVLAIDAATSRDPQIVGAKAAALARARAVGLPVPDSVVVPHATSRSALAAGRRLAAHMGVHAGRLEVMAAGQDELSAVVARARSLGPSLAVRSSARGEDDPLLAGAYSSLIGVRPEEVPKAVLAVWASAIGARAPRVVDEIAVLIQPELTPDYSGVAEVLGDGSVEVVLTNGAAAGLTGGWKPGLTMVASQDGAFSGATRRAAEEDAARLAADLARRVERSIGDNQVEWAVCADTVWLLQLRRCMRRSGPRDQRQCRAREGRAVGRRSAAIHRATVRAATCRGPFGERWVLPWAIGLPGGFDVAQRPVSCQDKDPIASWRELRHLSALLTRQVWRDSGAQPPADIDRIGPSLRAGRWPDGLPEVLAAPNPALVRRLTRIVQRLIGHLRQEGVIGHAAEFWSLPADIGALLAVRGSSFASVGASDALRAARSWEPALFAAVTALGEFFHGSGTSDGAGCGWAVLAANAVRQEGQGLPPRCVFVADLPLPRYAPLLMGASGLVTRGGSGGAHLVTVARALGVPVVTGCELAPLLSRHPRALVALDGSTGEVSLLAPKRITVT